MRALWGACSCGKSNCVGEGLGPKLPFWLVVVTDSDEVAVVVCGAPSILPARSGQHTQRCKGAYDVPSDSEATELRPLKL